MQGRELSNAIVSACGAKRVKAGSWQLKAVQETAAGWLRQENVYFAVIYTIC